MGAVEQDTASVGQTTGKRPISILYSCLEASHDKAEWRIVEFQLKKIDEVRSLALLPLSQQLQSVLPLVALEPVVTSLSAPPRHWHAEQHILAVAYPER